MDTSRQRESERRRPADAAPRFYVFPVDVLRKLDVAGEPSTGEQGWQVARLTATQAARARSLTEVADPLCTAGRDLSAMVRDSAPQDVLRQLLGFRSPEPTYPKPDRHPELVKKALKCVRSDRVECTLRDFVACSPDKKETPCRERCAGVAQGIDASTWIRDLLKTLPADRIDVEELEAGLHRQRSVLATLRGTSKAAPGVLLGAHLDVTESGFPGANDNASGVVTVLETLRAILDARLTLRNPVYFAFYASEEIDRAGSQAMADDFKKKGVRLLGVLNLDMTGSQIKDDEYTIHFAPGPCVSGTLSQFTADLARQYEVNGRARTLLTTAEAAPLSDHSSWATREYPVVFPMSSGTPSSYPAYHKKSDTVTAPMFSTSQMLQFVRLGVAFAVELGEPADTAELSSQANTLR